MTVVKRAGLSLLIVVCLLLVYGVAIEPRLLIDERHYRIPIPELPAPMEGTRVAVFSDLQVGMYLANLDAVAEIVDRVVAERPAAALIAGDFLYSQAPDPAAQIETVLTLLEPLVQSGIPTYAVLGNHDYAVGAADMLRARLEEHGIDVLQNEVAPIFPEGANEAVYVVGIGPHRPGLSEPAAALVDLPDDAPRVVFMHNPLSFLALPAGSAPIAVAGHTHCGQVALPFTPDLSYLVLTAPEELVVGGFAPPNHGAEGNRLFVTCGIGFSIVPVRIGAAPQLVFFELTLPQP